jgi:hypothetical protein
MPSLGKATATDRAISMSAQNSMPSPDEARELDYALQKVRFALLIAAVCCWLAAVVEYFIAKASLPIAVLTALAIPAGNLLVWSVGLRGARQSLSRFKDRGTGKLCIPGGRKSLPFSHGLSMIFWDKRETRVTTIGVSVAIVLLVGYLAFH